MPVPPMMFAVHKIHTSSWARTQRTWAEVPVTPDTRVADLADRAEAPVLHSGAIQSPDPYAEHSRERFRSPNPYAE